MDCSLDGLLYRTDGFLEPLCIRTLRSGNISDMIGVYPGHNQEEEVTQVVRGIL